MEWIVFSKTKANTISGNYGTCNSLQPILLTNGQYALPISVLEVPTFSEIRASLLRCETISNERYEELRDENS